MKTQITSWKAAIVALVVMALLSGTEDVVAQDSATKYVVVGSHVVNLRTGPSTDRALIGRADKGDLYAYVGETGDWFEIEMFSGDRRYIHKSFAYPLTEQQIVPGHNLQLPEDSVSRALRATIRWAIDRAEVEATEILPVSLDAERHATLRRILEDRILLEVFHRHGVQPVVYRMLPGVGGGGS
jgi:hypothetical protein